MARGNSRDILEFLFVGPLFSIFKVLNQIRRELRNVATQEQIDALTGKVSELGTTLDKVRNEVRGLKDQAANSQPPLDLSGLESAVDEARTKLGEVDDVVPDATPETPAETPTETPATPPAETPTDTTPTDSSESEGEVAFNPDGTPVNETPSDTGTPDGATDSSE